VMSGLFLRCLNQLDDRTSVKLLLHVWGPWFEFVVRLLRVATFLDDSFRVITHFSQHIDQVGEQGFLKPLAAASPGLVSIIASLALSVGLLAQSLGSFCLLAGHKSETGTKALIGWAIAQPVMYIQMTNFEFVAESLSIVGGLLILLSHLSEQAMRDGRKVPLGGGIIPCAPEAAIARTSLLGRLLLPAKYMYHAGVILVDNLTGAVDHTEYTSAMLLAEYGVNVAVLLGLLLLCALIAAGLKSRTIALVLALVNLVFVFCQHPFFTFVWREGGQWKYDKLAMSESMPHVALPKGASTDNFEPWHIVDLHRYYFFQGLSTTGALILLAMVGPGELAVVEDELLSKARQAHVVQASFA